MMKIYRIMDKILFRTAGDAVVEAKGKESRRVTFIASDSTRDAAGTVLNQEGWSLDRFNRNGIIGYQHNVYGGRDDNDNPDNVIGKGRAYTKDGKLYVDVDFEPKEINELADKIYNKILFGSLRAVSVGFLPKGRGSWGKGEEALDGNNPTYYYAGQELLEVSVVNIPANPNALKRTVEAMDEELAGLRGQEEKEEAKEDAAAEFSPLGAEAERQVTMAEAALL